MTRVQFPQETLDKGKAVDLLLLRFLNFNMPISQGSMHLYFYISGKPLNYLNFYKGLRESYKPSADEFAHLMSLVRKLLSTKYPNINNIPLDQLSKDHSVLIDKYLQLFKCCNSVFRMESSFLCSVDEATYNSMLQNPQFYHSMNSFVKSSLASDMHRLSDLTSREISNISVYFRNGGSGQVSLANIEEVHKVVEDFIDVAVKALQECASKQYGIQLTTDDCLFLVNSLMAFYNDRLFTTNSIIFSTFEYVLDFYPYLLGSVIIFLVGFIIYHSLRIKAILSFYK